MGPGRSAELKESHKVSRIRTYLLELVMCAVGVAAISLAYGIRAYAELFWGDEIITAEVIQLGAVDLVNNRYSQGHSPLYFLIAKTWMIMTASSESEFMLRVPSLIFMGLAGGFLAAAAARAWGMASGSLLLAMWLTNSFIAYYSVEARPYALLLLFLAISIWSATLLSLARSQSPSRNLVAISVMAPAFAAATLPLGAVAAIAMEVLGLCKRGDDMFARFWRRRALLSMSVTAATFAALMNWKRVDRWGDDAPLSWRTLGQVANQIYLNDWYSARHGPLVLAASLALILFAIRTLTIAWRDLTVRLATGLAILCPTALLALSMKESNLLDTPRYFIPAIPGILVLVAASVGNTPRRSRWSYAAAVTLLVITLGLQSPPHPRPFTPELQLALIEELKPGAITGGTSNWFVMKTLNYYLPRSTGLPAKISKLKKPLRFKDLPRGNEIYWLFDDGGMAGSARVLCSYQLKTGDVFVLGNSSADLPKSMRDRLQLDPNALIDYKCYETK